jgi:hypothetical protein
MARKKITITVEDLKDQKTYAYIILDQSGSMASCWQATLDGFNEQVQALKASEIDTYVSLIKFATFVENPVWNLPAKDIKELTRASYFPCGMTSMYDAVGITLNRIKNSREYNDPNAAFLICIISDGQENNSREFNQEQIATMMKEVQKTKRFTITYMGANQDLSKIEELNIPKKNITAWASTDNFVAGKSFNYNTVSTRHYVDARASGQMSVQSFYGGK